MLLRELFSRLDELDYKGAIGIMELMKFHSEASKEESHMLNKLIMVLRADSTTPEHREEIKDMIDELFVKVTGARLPGLRHQAEV